MKKTTEITTISISKGVRRRLNIQKWVFNQFSYDSILNFLMDEAEKTHLEQFKKELEI